jgi:hypothetical protein
MNKAPQIEVRVKQVWADCDPRSAGRTFQVEAIHRPYAECVILTNSDNVTERLNGNPGKDGWWYQPKDRRGASIRIRLNRLRPTSQGYRLVEDAPEEKHA